MIDPVWDLLSYMTCAAIISGNIRACKVELSGGESLFMRQYRLLDQGLISEEIYNAEAKELLDESL